MDHPEFWNWLRCPQTRQRLLVAEPGTVEQLNARIVAGQARNRGGQLVTAPIEAGLLTEDQTWLYPVRQRLPVLLADEAIAMQRPG